MFVVSACRVATGLSEDGALVGPCFLGCFGQTLCLCANGWGKIVISGVSRSSVCLRPVPVWLVDLLFAIFCGRLCVSD